MSGYFILVQQCGIFLACQMYLCLHFFKNRQCTVSSNHFTILKKQSVWDIGRKEQRRGQLSYFIIQLKSVPWSHFMSLYSRNSWGCSTLNPCSFFLLKLWLNTCYYPTGKEMFISPRIHLRMSLAQWKDITLITVQGGAITLSL